MYPFVKCKINGEKEYLLEKIYKLFMVNKIKEQSIEEIIGFMKNVDIVYPNAQVIENEIDELLSRSVIKIPTVHL